MAISNYSELQTSLSNWSHRADLTSLLPDFIRLAETKLNRYLRTRDMELETTLTPSSGVCTLPTDFLASRRVYINTSSPIELEYLAPEQFYIQFPTTAGGSKYFTIESNTIILADRGATSVKLLYYQVIPALASNSTNWLLTSHPDLYLAASMAELNDYVKNTNEMAKWTEKAKGIAEAVMSSDKSGKYSGSALRVIAS